MQEVIFDLDNNVSSIEQMQRTFDILTNHGSTDQTRSMLFQSMFEQAKGNIRIAIEQLKILERELY